MTPDVAPRRRDRPAPSPPTSEELEGYLVGVERRIAERAAAGADVAGFQAELARATAAVRRGDLGAADRTLRAVDAALDALTPEVEMTDRPRGLVAFRTVGDPGVPMDREEDPVANRLVLVGRLASVREAEGHDVTVARGLLADAERAFAAGDRAAARRAVDRAHARLDPSDPDHDPQRIA